MKKFNTYILVSVVLIFIIGGIFFLFTKNNKEAERSLSQQNFILKGETLAPDFTFTTVDNKTISLSSLRGSPVIMSFVLTVGCVPCKAEALNIRAAQKEVNLKVIQIGISPYESEDDLRDFRKNFGSSDWIIGLDKDQKITDLYKVRTVDTTILINAEGKIIYRDDGYPIETWTIIDLLGKK